MTLQSLKIIQRAHKNKMGHEPGSIVADSGILMADPGEKFLAVIEAVSDVLSHTLHQKVIDYVEIKLRIGDQYTRVQLHGANLHVGVSLQHYVGHSAFFEAVMMTANEGQYVWWMWKFEVDHGNGSE